MTDLREPDGFAIHNFKPFTKNNLKAFFDVELPSGMVIRSCMLFEKNGARWISLPSKKFVSVSGTETYIAIVEIPDKRLADEFRRLTLNAIDAMRGQP
jgi:hypothetical protein